MAGAMRKNPSPRLAVVGRPAWEVTADRGSNHHRAGERVVRAIPKHRHLVAHLHHRRPDVIEKLNLNDWLQAPGRHTDASADDVRLGQRRIEHARAAKKPLKSMRDLEHAPLTRDVFER